MPRRPDMIVKKVRPARIQAGANRRTQVPMKQSIHIYKANLFKALGHPLRLAILDALRDGEKTVTQLQEITGGEQASMSQHLKVLRQHHFVTARRDGTLSYYRNEDPDVYQFLDLGRQIYTQQVNRRRAQLEEIEDLT